ncbi:MAG: hypothetical protein AAF197_09580, partial [Pseudomonadota bacterium]
MFNSVVHYLRVVVFSLLLSPYIVKAETGTQDVAERHAGKSPIAEVIREASTAKGEKVEPKNVKIEDTEDDLPENKLSDAVDNPLLKLLNVKLGEQISASQGRSYDIQQDQTKSTGQIKSTTSSDLGNQTKPQTGDSPATKTDDIKGGVDGDGIKDRILQKLDDTGATNTQNTPASSISGKVEESINQPDGDDIANSVNKKLQSLDNLDPNGSANVTGNAVDTSTPDERAIEKRVAERTKSIDTDRRTIEQRVDDSTGAIDADAITKSVENRAQNAESAIGTDESTDTVGKDVASSIDGDEIAKSVSDAAESAADTDAGNQVSVDSPDINEDSTADNVEAQVDSSLAEDQGSSVDAQSIQQRVEDSLSNDPAVDTSSIKDKVLESVSTDQIGKKLNEGVDQSAITDNIESKIDSAKTTIDIALDTAKDKIVAATQQAYAGVEDQLDGQKADALADYNAKKATYDSIVIPDKQYEQISYNCHRRITTLWTRKTCDHKNVETSASIQARSDATAQKDLAKGEMDGAKDNYDQIVQAEDGVNDDETASIATITDAFDNAKVQVDTASALGNPSTEENIATTRPTGSQSSDLKVVDVTGSINNTIIDIGDVDAAIGVNAVAISRVGNIGDNLERDVQINSIVQNVNAGGTVNAAIGNDTTATLDVANINGDAEGTLTRVIDTVGVVNASIGNATNSTIAINDFSGQASSGFSEVTNVLGAISAAIGNNSDSSLRIANNAADLASGSFSSQVAVAASVSASIGSNTTSTVEIANIGEQTLNQSVTINVDSGPVISAPIGAQSFSEVLVGNINGDVLGGTDLEVIVGAIISAAIGFNSDSVVHVGNIDGDISGRLDV